MQNSNGKYLCRILFFNKIAACRFVILLKKRLQNRWLLVNFAKFSRTSLLQNTSGRIGAGLWTGICEALRYLVPFTQFKKREKKPHEERFFKLYKWYQIALNVSLQGRSSYIFLCILGCVHCLQRQVNIGFIWVEWE